MYACLCVWEGEPQRARLTSGLCVWCRIYSSDVLWLCCYHYYLFVVVVQLVFLVNNFICNCISLGTRVIVLPASTERILKSCWQKHYLSWSRQLWLYRIICNIPIGHNSRSVAKSTPSSRIIRSCLFCMPRLGVIQLYSWPLIGIHAVNTHCKTACLLLFFFLT